MHMSRWSANTNLKSSDIDETKGDIKIISSNLVESHIFHPHPSLPPDLLDSPFVFPKWRHVPPVEYLKHGFWMLQ